MFAILLWKLPPPHLWQKRNNLYEWEHFMYCVCVFAVRRTTKGNPLWWGIMFILSMYSLFVKTYLAWPIYRCRCACMFCVHWKHFIKRINRIICQKIGVCLMVWMCVSGRVADAKSYAGSNDVIIWELRARSLLMSSFFFISWLLMLEWFGLTSIYFEWLMRRINILENIRRVNSVYPFMRSNLIDEYDSLCSLEMLFGLRVMLELYKAPRVQNGQIDNLILTESLKRQQVAVEFYVERSWNSDFCCRWFCCRFRTSLLIFLPLPNSTILFCSHLVVVLAFHTCNVHKPFYARINLWVYEIMPMKWVYFNIVDRMDDNFVNEI